MKTSFASIVYLLGQEAQEVLKLDDDLLRLWDDLVRCLPPLAYYPLWDLPTLDQKTSLAEWVVEIAPFFPKLSGQPRIGYTLPLGLQAIEIWRDSGHSYWTDIGSCLNAWQTLADTILVKVEWTIDSDVVRIIMRWKGSFRSLEAFDIEEAKIAFWTVSYQADQPIGLSQASNALLLCAQLMARRRGNVLIPVELHKGQLVIKMEVPRADRPSASSPVSLVSESVFDRIINHIVTESLLRYVETSQRLETALSEEVTRLETQVHKGTIEGTLLNKLREMLDQLRSARESFVTDC
jgi:hypothetical protein